MESQQKELEAAAEVIRAELNANLEEKGVDELKTKNFIVRWKEIISSRLDSKSLKAALPAIPGRRKRQSGPRRRNCRNAGLRPAAGPVRPQDSGPSRSQHAQDFPFQTGDNALFQA